METKVAETKKGLNNNVVKGENTVTKENKNPQFVAGNPVNKDSAKPAEPAKPVEETPKTEAPKVEAAKAEQPKAEPAQQAAQATFGKVEAPKPALNLESTLKLVEELHRRKIQRDKLIESIDLLEAFEVDQKDEDDEDTDRNIYQGCKLTIVDSNNRAFVTKNATVIWTVAQMVNNLFVNKLAEIEAGITIPA